MNGASSGESADAAVRELVERSGHFDPVYYRRQRAGLPEVEDLLGHFLASGWREGLDPSASFDTTMYLATNDDVAACGMNPLVHFIAFGRGEGRIAPRPELAPPGVTARAAAPTRAEWAALPPSSSQPAVVDVIVPVYGGFAETMCCLYSVLRAPVKTAYALCVIDDASPEPELAAALDELAAAGRVTLTRNAENLGFVRTVNAAMRRHTQRDVVLLNADTEVFGDWLDRIRAGSAPQDVGTVTPFSNNGEICSYPAFMRDNDGYLELGDAELDALAAEVNSGECVDLPTAVGFCTYITRACLDAVGYFDEGSFARGYGEENDFSRRAAAAGWRHVLAADVFVRHYGATSFGASKTALAASALQTLNRLHPGYSDVIRAFVGADPVRPYRERIDVARVRRARRGRTFLFVTHNRGGGTERHVAALAQRIAGGGDDVLFCRAVNRSGSSVLFDSPVLRVPNLRMFDIPGDLEPFAATLTALGVDHLHVHHLADLPASAPDFLRVAAARAGIAYDVTIHDYLFVCPRINLIDASGFYCGEPGEDGCTRCLSRDPPELGSPPIWEWRERHDRFVRAARAVFVPNEDVAARMQRYFAGVAFTVRPHPDDAPAADALTAYEHAATAAAQTARRRIGVIGATGPHKGSRLLLACARDARERGVPLDFVVIGYSDIDGPLREAGVTVTGAYAEDELPALIDAARLDVAWFASVWPETYCYTLSAALSAGVFPIAFDLGAVAARLRSIGWGHLLPIASFFDVGRVVDALYRVPVTPPPPHALVADPPAADDTFVASYYGLAPSAAAPARR